MRTPIAIHSDKILNDRWWGLQGFDTRKDPFTLPGAAGVVVYRNTMRDASGRHDGYLFADGIVDMPITVKTVAEAVEVVKPYVPNVSTPDDEVGFAMFNANTDDGVVVFQLRLSHKRHPASKIDEIVADFQANNPFYNWVIQQGGTPLVITDDVALSVIPELKPNEALSIRLNVDALSHERALAFANDTKDAMKALFPNNNIIVTAATHHIEVVELVNR